MLQNDDDEGSRHKTVAHYRLQKEWGIVKAASRSSSGHKRQRHGESILKADDPRFPGQHQKPARRSRRHEVKKERSHDVAGYGGHEANRFGEKGADDKDETCRNKRKRDAQPVEAITAFVQGLAELEGVCRKMNVARFVMRRGNNK